MLLFVACNKNVLYSHYESLDETTGWPAKRILRFETEVKDTNQLYDVYVNIRNTENYNYRNLFLFLHTYYPDGMKFTDTIECILSDERGHWLGKGMGDLYDNSILFKKNARFTKAGKYYFDFEQAMRYGNKNEIDPLYMIKDVGFTIEKAR